MIVRHFLDWVRPARAGERADATAALARSYLYSDLSADDAAAAEGAMLMMLDDPSPLVRGAAVWALSRLLPAERLAVLAMDQRARESEPLVADEWTAALAATAA